MNLKDLYRRFRAWQRQPFKYDVADHEQHHCANCDSDFEGNYCPVCGQKKEVGRADWYALRDELIEVGGLKEPQSFLSFLAQLFGRPGYLISDYISGRRNVCSPPIEKLGLIAVIAMVIDKLTVNPQTDWVMDLAAKGGPFGPLLGWLAEHLNWAILLQTVLLIFPTWLLFRYAPRHTRHTLPEGIYIQVFMGSLVLICVILRSLISNWFFMLVPVFYYITYKQLFGYGVWGTLWRTVMCLGIIMYFFGVLMMVRTHISGEFWEQVSTVGFVVMIVLFIAIGAGILALGWWIGKRTAAKD